ncbi:MAG: DUF3109 family protein [Ignavibacteriaceae bacterium]|nr:DUF3109 family protein [Ignavibacteriaceae bacterium]
MFSNNFIKIDDVLVNTEITKTKFTCDLEKCKGACCTLESDYGAPLLKEEIPLMVEAYPHAKTYLSEVSISKIESEGFYDTHESEFLTKSIDKKDCVFVYYDNDIAKCSFEKAYFEGKSNFRKPISCHLFPIRISDFGGEVLRYEKFDECKPALANGEKSNMTIVELCDDALIRKYGSDWVNLLKANMER